MRKLLLTTIFIAMAAVALVIVAALATGAWQYSSASAAATEHAFEAARSVSVYVKDQQLRRLKLASSLLASNADFAAGLERAMPADQGGEAVRDVPAIRDLLTQQLRLANLDAAAILDASGKFVAAGGESFLPEHDLSSLAVTLRSAHDLVPTAALLDDDATVPLVAVTPLVDGTRLKALLVTGVRMDAGSLRTIADLAGANLALVVIEPTGPSIVESTLDEHTVEQLATALEKDRTRWSGADSADLNVDLDGRQTTARSWPVQATAKKAFFLALPSPALRESIERVLVPPLIVAACCTLLVLSIVLLFLWRRALAPLAAMTELSELARRGDFALQLKPQGFDLVRRVADLINYLLRELDRHRVPHGVPRRRVTDTR